MMQVEQKRRGRKKIEIKRIEKESDRLVTFSKRMAGIHKKANELTTLCGADVGVVVFLPDGKPFSYGHPSIEAIANRYLNLNPPHNKNTHPYVETQRKIKIQEMSDELNDLEAKLEEENKKAKHLRKLKETSQGKGWWEVPIKDLKKTDVEKVKRLMDNFYPRLVERAKELSGGALSSGGSSKSFVSMNFGTPQAKEIWNNNTNVITYDDIVKPNIAQLNNMAP
ncbi:hypothetical protein ACFE04_031200 [Oxalis oulophora]